MKRILAALLCALFCLCLSGCGNTAYQDGTEEISEFEAWVLFRQELVEKIEDTYGDDYYDFSSFKYRYEAEDNESSYSIEGEYDVYFKWGDYAKTCNFSGFVTKDGSYVKVENFL